MWTVVAGLGEAGREEGPSEPARRADLIRGSSRTGPVVPTPYGRPQHKHSTNPTSQINIQTSSGRSLAN